LEPVRGTTSDGIPFSGYEMHMGLTEGLDRARPFARLSDGSSEGAVSADGRVSGTYIHGLFADDRQRSAWLSALAQVAQRSRTTHWLMKPWTGLRRILWPTSISIVCSAYRDERGGEHGNESDQDCVGATVKSERNPNIGGCCRIATVSHEGVVDA